MLLPGARNPKNGEDENAAPGQVRCDLRWAHRQRRPQLSPRERQGPPRRAHPQAGGAAAADRAAVITGAFVNRCRFQRRRFL